MASGLNEPEIPLSPTAQTIAPPGLVDTERARDRYQQTLAVRRQADDRHGEAEILRDLGDLSGDVGHRKAAHRSWVQALAILEDLGDARACAEIRDRLGLPGLTAGLEAQGLRATPPWADTPSAGGTSPGSGRHSCT
jgi:hypothetical protein